MRYSELKHRQSPITCSLYALCEKQEKHIKAIFLAMFHRIAEFTHIPEPFDTV